jgi:transcriptional regulator with XRE-family HTH domain
MDVLAKNLRARAQELGISNAEAARRSGISERRYGNYTTGFRDPDLQTLVQIAKALHCTPNDLLGVTEDLDDASEAARLRREVVAAITVLDQRHLETLLIEVRALASH